MNNLLTNNKNPLFITDSESRKVFFTQPLSEKIHCQRDESIIPFTRRTLELDKTLDSDNMEILNQAPFEIRNDFLNNKLVVSQAFCDSDKIFIKNFPFNDNDKLNYVKSILLANLENTPLLDYLYSLITNLPSNLMLHHFQPVINIVSYGALGLDGDFSDPIDLRPVLIVTYNTLNLIRWLSFFHSNLGSTLCYQDIWYNSDPKFLESISNFIEAANNELSNNELSNNELSNNEEYLTPKPRLYMINKATQSLIYLLSGDILACELELNPKSLSQFLTIIVEADKKS